MCLGGLLQEILVYGAAFRLLGQIVAVFDSVALFLGTSTSTWRGSGRGRLSYWIVQSPPAGDTGLSLLLAHCFLSSSAKLSKLVPHLHGPWGPCKLLAYLLEFKATKGEWDRIGSRMEMGGLLLSGS